MIAHQADDFTSPVTVEVAQKLARHELGELRTECLFAQPTAEAVGGNGAQNEQV
jgi:hypothetical protein